MSCSLFDVCVSVMLLSVGLCDSPSLFDQQCHVSIDCPRNLDCIDGKCTDPCLGTCGTNANCILVNHNPFCSCPTGYTGDPFIECIYMEEAGDNETETVATSLTGSKTPFAYIKAECVNSTFSCRKFTCTALSSVMPSISWRFKPCLGDICVSINRSGTTEQHGLQVSSTVVLQKRDYGYLYCIVENSEDKIEMEQEVVPYNNSGQVFIKLKEVQFYSEFHPYEGFVEIFWFISVEGYPEPSITLLINNKTAPKSSAKYGTKYKISEYDPKYIRLIIKNMSKEDLKTQFSLQAINDYENKFLNLSFRISDFFYVSATVESLYSTNATLKCVAVSVLASEIKWFLDSEQIPEVFSNKTNLAVTSYINVNSSNRGNLVCSTDSLPNRKWTQDIKSIVGSIDVSGPSDIVTVDEKTKRIYLDYNVRSLTLTCSISAHNHTNYIELERTDKVTLNFNEAWSTLFSYHRNFTVPGFEASYFCKTKNLTHDGTYEFLAIEILFRGAPTWPYSTLIALVVLILLISAYVVVKVRNYQKLRKEMKELNTVGLANFEKGALEHLNPNLTIDDQADLLPYDKKYELPIEKLKLGEQIGSGAFGVVLKGEAKGIFEGESSTIVAVKMVNKNIGDFYIRSLASELKIMIYLGKHVNVVNLLGACTKNIAKRELLVIVEYCRFGNLKDYILSHRPTFIDQISAETGQIDFDIGSDVLLIKSSGNSENPSMEQDNTEIDEESRYKGDYEDENKPICTKDLLIWSFQVARGMEYLVSRNVLHGDLAARNILLTDDNTVKICDFGLSKKMYQKDIYKKSGNEMLPVKWMAIEAITDKIFSVQSDVWSFGVVLWEFFSLGRRPYPGMQYNEWFCERLLEGYRMEAPHYADPQIYDLMLRCWDGEPMKRPSFTQLAHEIGLILDETSRKYYIDMNADYLKMNAQKFSEENPDYLSMVGAPSFSKYSGPYNYVNSVNFANDDNNETNTYL